MDRISLQQVMDNAPDWATHISVCSYTGIPEYYNTVQGTILSRGVRSPDKPPVILKNSFGVRLLSGDTSWEVVPIQPPCSPQ